MESPESRTVINEKTTLIKFRNRAFVGMKLNCFLLLTRDLTNLPTYYWRLIYFRDGFGADSAILSDIPAQCLWQPADHCGFGGE